MIIAMDVGAKEPALRELCLAQVRLQYDTPEGPVFKAVEMRLDAWRSDNPEVHVLATMVRLFDGALIAALGEGHAPRVHLRH